MRFVNYHSVSSAAICCSTAYCHGRGIRPCGKETRNVRLMPQCLEFVYHTFDPFTTQMAPFGALGSNVRSPPVARWKARGRHPICRNWTFSLSLTVETSKSVEVGVYRMGWITLSANFWQKGAPPTNHCWCQKSRVIAVSCGIKISALHCLVLSESTRASDGRTELRQLNLYLHQAVPIKAQVDG